MESEEIEMKLDDILKSIEIKIKYLEKIEQKFNSIVKIVDEIDEKERNFLKLFSESKKLGEKLIFYFEGSEGSEKLQIICEEIEKTRLDYEKECKSFKDKVTSVEFDENKLNEFKNYLDSFLLTKIESIKNMLSSMQGSFDESLKKVKNELLVLNRLFNTLTKGIKNILEKHDPSLEEFLGIKQKHIQQIEAEIPLGIEDLSKGDGELESLRGLYVRIKTAISSCKEDLRRFAIEKGLLLEDEIIILEIIYESSEREFDFNEVVETLKEKMSGKSDEDVQSLLFNLSRKGFLTLKLIVD